MFLFPRRVFRYEIHQINLWHGTSGLGFSICLPVVQFRQARFKFKDVQLMQIIRNSANKTDFTARNVRQKKMTL